MTREERDAHTQMIPPVTATPPEGVPQADATLLPTHPPNWPYLHGTPPRDDDGLTLGGVLRIVLVSLVMGAVAVTLALAGLYVWTEHQAGQEHDDAIIRNMQLTWDRMDATVARMPDEQVAANCKQFNTRGLREQTVDGFVASLNTWEDREYPSPDRGMVTAYINSMCTDGGWGRIKS